MSKTSAASVNVNNNKKISQFTGDKIEKDKIYSAVIFTIFEKCDQISEGHG